MLKGNRLSFWIGFSLWAPRADDLPTYHIFDWTDFGTMGITKMNSNLFCAVTVLAFSFFSVCAIQAQSISSFSDCQSLVPRSAVYIGFGGSSSSTYFGTQDVIAIGESTIYDSDITSPTYGQVIAEGYAQGPDDATGGTPFYMDSELTISPSVQIGYFRHFNNSGNKLWGFKFTNDYINASSSLRDVRLPQVGQFTNLTDPDPTTNTVAFTGNAVARSARNRVIDQISFRPYLGHSFGRGFLYLGGGPSLSYLRTEVEDLVGFADIKRPIEDISGPPQDFRDSGWAWGGSAEFGVTYFLNQCWFLDCSYVLNLTGERTFYFSSTFDSQNELGDLEGSLIGSSTWSPITQAFSVKLCRAF